jgi:ribosomal protein S18 acetylase RimI-like enzyme
MASVGAEAVHGLRVLHRRVVAQLDVERLAEDVADHALEHRADLFLGQEAGLDIDLRELGLAVGAQVLVAEALGDLVVAVKARHHQQLLEQLGRLRQREEVAVMHAAGHEVVARAFRRALGQHRRLDVDEAVLVQELADFHRDAVAQHQVVLHVGTAQVQHAVRQTGRLAEVFFVDLEGDGHRRVQHLDLVAEHLDLAGHEVGVLGAGRARAHLADDLEAVLAADVFGDLEAVGAVGVADDLDQAFAVAQVDEDDAAMVAAAVGPAHQGHGLVEQLFADLAGIAGTHGISP